MSYKEAAFKTALNLIANKVVADDKSIDVSSRTYLVESITELLVKAHEDGQMDAINVLFPNLTDEYNRGTPLRDAAIKTVFQE